MIRNYNFIIKQKITELLEYILLILIIIEFNTPYPQLFESVQFAVRNLGIFILLCVVILRGKVKLDVMSCCLLLGSIIPLIGVSSDRIIELIKIFAVYIPLFYVFFASHNSRTIILFFLKYSNIVLIVAIVSLFFWLFGSILGIITPTMKVPYEWGGLKIIPTYYGLYFETQEAYATVESDLTIRNSGIFNEAPMYNMILCTALGIELFLRKKLSYWRIIIFVATIVTTISTTGFLFLLLVMTYKLYIAMSGKLRILIVVFIPFLLIIASFTAQMILENKIMTNTSSFYARSSDIQKCIEIGMDNPLIGIGMDADNNTSKNRTAMWGYSNSLFTVFARGGIYVLSLYVFALFYVPLSLYKRNPNLAMLIFGFAIVFSFTISYLRLLTLMMIGFGMSLYVVNRKKVYKDKEFNEHYVI